MVDEIQNKEVEARKEQAKGFFKKNINGLFIVILLLLVILGIYIRIQPLLDHNGHPGLWDITTNDYTLGPDLDPFLFLRYAGEIINGGLPAIDTMRYSPLGFDSSSELQMVSYAIVATYYLVNLFGTYSINFAGAFMPVIAFAFTIIAFFFFVREIFIRRDEKSRLKANIIASISTFFMVTIPTFLQRTVAGIPEKESLAFLFMFMAFYFFLKAWKSEKYSGAVILSLLAGLLTVAMGLTWAGIIYIYVTIGLAVFLALLINKIDKRKILSYSLWLISTLFLTFTLSNRFPTLREFISGVVINIGYAGIAVFTLIVLIMHLLLWHTSKKLKEKLERINLPPSIITIIITLTLGIIFLLIVNPWFIVDKTTGLYHTLVKPTTGRWITTVAENRQPYLYEWIGSFGEAFFYLFILGSIVLFKKTFSSLERRKSWMLAGLYCFFLIGLILSRYAPHPNLFDGEGAISILLYFGSALLLIGTAVYYYVQDCRKKEHKFEMIEFEYIFVLSLLVLCLFTARSAVRLIMVLAPIATIFAGFLVGELFEKMKNKNEGNSNKKFFIIIAFITIVVLSVYVGFTYYQSIKNQSYNQVPYYYTFQWQEAMSWVRENTPVNAVFAHWWDYGYWIQTKGERASMTDGGNAIVWWNYLTGRYLLTGDNQQEALDLCYAHNVSYFLADSSDIGKYGAYSQIGSDANFDRISQGPIALFSDQKQIQETKNGTLRNYNIPSGNGFSLVPLEEDVIYNDTTLFKENTALIGVTTESSNSYRQPIAMFYSNGMQVPIPMRYLYYNGTFTDYGSGINATAYVIQKISNVGNGQLQLDETGAMIYISPRVMKSLFAQVYILDDPFKKFTAFNLVHNEPDFILNEVSKQGMPVREFAYFYGIMGPIKIYNITYPADQKLNPEYLRTDIPKNITWKF